MNFAIIGGTHGNELVGIEVMRGLERKVPIGSIHQYKTFLGNPKAYELKRRYVDSDLNRSFGKNGKALGYEVDRSKDLQTQIVGKFDFLLDLHTTTSDMGLTVILNCDDELSLKAACYLQKKMPEIKIIKSAVLNDQCPYTNAMVTSGLTVEVGAVANNVIKAHLVASVYEMVCLLLRWDFCDELEFSEVKYYQTLDNLHFPDEGHWMIHPNVDDHAFKAIKPGDSLFVNIEGEQLKYTGEQVVYPFFINEAAYQESNIAMSLSSLEKGL